jgi:serine phosphatase RsbU (regulator of sigma subunit)/DNA-binding response OmpR family regulator/anti-sigma regulatory factor (Ser/Thr protein kinase)
VSTAHDPQQNAIGILLVDDHRENLTALQAVLEPLGERLVCAESGEQALRVLLREEISVILLDVRMAGLDGVETARLIRSRSRTRHIPIIFLTAQASDVAEVALAYKTGAVDYVVKPFDPDILRAKVAVFCELHRERAERVRQSEGRSRAEAMARAAQTLQSLSDTALSHLELEGLGSELLTRTSELFGADAGALLIATGEAPGLQVTATSGLPLGFTPSRFVVPAEGVLGRIATPHRGELLRGGEVAAALTALGAPEPGAAIDNGVAELVIVPMISGGQLVGLLLLGSAIPRRFGEQDLELLLLAADRMALAIRHAQRFAEGRELVEMLQRSLLPESLPHNPRLELAARYLPSGLGQQVGGDWYDALELDRHRTAVMIGDVVGHGIRAATKMSELRNALRAYAAEGHSPTQALELLDRLVQSTLGTEMVGTVLCIVIDVESQTLTVARAGHPPPAVRGVDGTVRFLESASMLPVGIKGHKPATESVHPIEPGETLLLFTDGLVERRRESISIGLERLAHALKSAPPDADALCDHVLARTTAEQTSSDDIAMLAVTLLPAGVERLSLVLSATADSVPEARHGLRRWLDETVPALDRMTRGDLELVLTEACTNAVRHAYDTPLASYTASAALDHDTIAIEVRDTGRWRRPSGDGGGHGIPLMRELSDELEIDSSDVGTIVRMRVQLAPADVLRPVSR